MKNLMIYLVAMAGIGTAFSMISQLERRCAAAERARDAYRPIVTQYFDSQSGMEDAPPPPSLSADEQMDLRMLDDGERQSMVSPKVAKWLSIAGFVLFAGCLGLQSRMEKKVEADDGKRSA